MAHDGRIGDEALDVARGEPCDARELETGECGAKSIALGEDRAPAQSRLKALEAQLLEQPAIIGNGIAPFAIVVSGVERVVIAGPPAPLRVRAVRNRSGDGLQCNGEPARSCSAASACVSPSKKASTGDTSRRRSMRKHWLIIELAPSAAGTSSGGMAAIGPCSG